MLVFQGCTFNCILCTLKLEKDDFKFQEFIDSYFFKMSSTINQLNRVCLNKTATASPSGLSIFVIFLQAQLGEIQQFN